MIGCSKSAQRAKRLGYIIFPNNSIWPKYENIYDYFISVESHYTATADVSQQVRRPSHFRSHILSRFPFNFLSLTTIVAMFTIFAKLKHFFTRESESEPRGKAKPTRRKKRAQKRFAREHIQRVRAREQELLRARTAKPTWQWIEPYQKETSRR